MSERNRERERERESEKEQDGQFFKDSVLVHFCGVIFVCLMEEIHYISLKLLFGNHSFKSHNKFVVLEHIIPIDDSTYILPHQNHTFCRNCYMST